MTAYLFFDVCGIIDPDSAAAYRAQVFDTVARYDGRYLVLGGPVQTIEGAWQPAIPVIIEFPRLERPRDGYGCDVHLPLKMLRVTAMRSEAVLLEGFNPAQESVNV